MFTINFYIKVLDNFCILRFLFFTNIDFNIGLIMVHYVRVLYVNTYAVKDFCGNIHSSRTTMM